MSGSARHQVAVNLGFTLLKSFFVLLSISLADIMLSAQMMGLVLLFRRQGALWSNLIQLGLSQVLLKYYGSSADTVYRARLWNVLLRWVFAAMLVTTLGCALFAEQVNQWLFPSAAPVVAAAFGVYVAGLALGFIAGASWAAEFRFAELNLIDWLHGSLLFVICLVVGSSLDMAVFSWLLALLTLTASVFSLKSFARKFGFRLYVPDIGWHLPRQERNYGFSRALSAYADMATLVIGPWMLRHQPAEAAQLILAYTVLRITQTLVMPVAQVFALRANSQRYDSNREARRIVILTTIVFACAWVVVAIYYFFGSLMVSLWLPNTGAGVIGVLDALMPFMPGTCLFYTLRNHVELQYQFPWNLLILTAGLLGFVVVNELALEEGIDAVICASQFMFILFYAYGAIALIAILNKKDLLDIS